MVAMAPAALVTAMDRQHGAIVHASAPHIGKAIEQPGMAVGLWAESDTANCDIFFNTRLPKPTYSTTWSRILKRRSGNGQKQNLIQVR